MSRASSGHRGTDSDSDKISQQSRDQFSYQTRVVVYNFLGLVPSNSSARTSERQPSPYDAKDIDGLQTDGLTDQNAESALSYSDGLRSWHSDLRQLPMVSLIDRLQQSQEVLQSSTAVAKELQEKVKPCEPTSDDIGSRMGSVLKCPDRSGPVETAVRDGEPLERPTSQEDDLGVVTVIQKKNRLKRLTDPHLYSDLGVISEVPEQTKHSSDGNVSLLVHSAHFDRGTISPDVQKYARSRSSSPDSAKYGRKLVTRGYAFSKGSKTPAEKSPYSSDAPSLRKVSRESSPVGEIVEVPVEVESSIEGGGAIERQVSSISGGTSRLSSYVDIQDVEDIESLVQSKTIPPFSLPLRRAISEGIEELEEKYFSEETAVGQQQNLCISARDSASTPESDVADNLRAIGDLVQEKYGDELDVVVQQLIHGAPQQAPTYEMIRAASLVLLDHYPTGWSKVALLMLFGQKLVYGLLRSGYTGIGQLAEYTAMLIEDQAADFIINNGGWQSISEIAPVETPLSNIAGNANNPPLLNPVDQSENACYQCGLLSATLPTGQCTGLAGKDCKQCSKATADCKHCSQAAAECKHCSCGQLSSNEIQLIRQKSEELVRERENYSRTANDIRLMIALALALGAACVVGICVLHKKR